MSASSFRVVPGSRFAFLTEAEHADLVEKARRVSILDRVFGQAEICGLSNYGLEGDETSLKVVFPTQRDAISALDVIKDARNIHGDRVVRPWDRDRVDISKTEHADLLAGRDEVARMKSELDAALSRAEAAERAAQDANEALRSLRSDQFECERLFPVGDVEGDGNVWVRVRSTDDGIRLLLKQIFQLDARAVFAEAALERANERCRHAEKRDWIAGELRRSEFEWQDTIPVDELGGDRVLVPVRGTEGGIAKIKAFIERQEGCRKEFYTAWEEADARADAAELRVRDLEGTVETYARFARAMRQLDVATEAA